MQPPKWLGYAHIRLTTQALNDSRLCANAIVKQSCYLMHAIKRNRREMQRQYRLSANASFNYIYKKGKSCHSKDLILLYVPTKYSFKVGFTVSKKVGKAVVRNKTKRRLRNGFMTLIPALNKSFNYIFVAKTEAGERSYSELLTQMQLLLIKAGMLSQ